MMNEMISPAVDLVTVNACHVDAVNEVLTKLAKKAARYGQSIVWTVAQRTITKNVYRWDGKRVERAYQVADFAISGSAPRAGNFTFLASLERTPGGVMVAAIPGVEIGAQGHDWDGSCDHCGRNRQRTTAFVVENEAGRKIVGRSCLRDHLGMDEPASLVAAFNVIREIGDIDPNEPNSRFGAGAWHQETVAVIAAARASIALWGWAPKTSGDGATAYKVGLLTAQLGRRDDQRRADKARLLRELRLRGTHYDTEARKVIDWARTNTDRGDYMHNLKVAVSADYANDKTFGLIVSAAAAYDRQIARQAERAAAPVSNHVGKIKDRMTATVTVERLISLPDYGYGAMMIYRFRDAAGNILAWKTSADTELCIADQPVEVGNRVSLTFTVKDHAEYKGTKETRVNRCKAATI